LKTLKIRTSKTRSFDNKKSGWYDLTLYHKPNSESSYSCYNILSFMATPIMTGDPAMQQYLRMQYERYHRFHSIFEFNPGLTKQEAHAAAFQAMLAAKRAAEQQRR
jgi:hypothetical protein